MTHKKVHVFFPYTELKKQVESAELKNQRLKEVFQTKIQEFRKVCYTLTGYQIDITTENQYRLSSIYAEHQGDCLLFKVLKYYPALVIHDPLRIRDVVWELAYDFVN
ncbi:mitotic spindle assembly checkpoint protein MAD1-like isoform X3 [Pitangus sulphuratus]|nr:mitotic spindle assembly checkpoint protein MAD1-like isoform X3 [Pitangus sulphuratus]